MPVGEAGRKTEVSMNQETKLLANTKQSSWIMRRCLEALGSSGGSPEVR